MKEWKIPVSYLMGGNVYVQADTLEEAMDLARDERNDSISLPEDAEYYGGSWELATEDIDAIRRDYNGGQKDELAGGLTVEMVSEAFQRGIIRLVESPNSDGTVGKIGDSWFYFGGLAAEGSTPTEYIENVLEADIIDEIFSAIKDLWSSGCNEEVLYYKHFIEEELQREYILRDVGDFLVSRNRITGRYFYAKRDFPNNWVEVKIVARLSSPTATLAPFDQLRKMYPCVCCGAVECGDHIEFLWFDFV